MYKLNITCEHATGLYTSPLVLVGLNIFERKGQDETCVLWCYLTRCITYPEHACVPLFHLVTNKKSSATFIAM